MKLYPYIKKGIDFIGLICLSPLCIILAISIKIDSKGPVFLKQKRIGKNKRYFYILKFRTMRMDTLKDISTHFLEDPYQWITKVGRFLRKTSLDELPQIINILKDEMLRGYVKEIKLYI